MSDSLTVAHLSWVTWAIHSQSLICREWSEQIAYSCSFDLSQMSEFPSLCTMQIFQMVNQYFKLHYDEFSKCRIKIRYNDRGTFNAAELLAQALMNSNFANENIHCSIRYDFHSSFCRFNRDADPHNFIRIRILHFILTNLYPDPKNVGNMFLIL